MSAALRSLQIIVDGTVLGVIKYGETAVFESPDSGQEIWGKMDWGITPRLTLSDYAPDKTVVFEGYVTLNPLKNLGLMEMPFKVFLK